VHARVRSANILLVIAIAVLIPSTGYCQAPTAATGSVCIGPNLSFDPDNYRKGATYITVGESEKFSFDHAGIIALNNLDLHKSYVVRVFFDGQQIQSWNLRFDRLKTRMVTIWRSPGYWHMDPTRSGKCRDR